MNLWRYKNNLFVLLMLMWVTESAYSEADWLSVTMDNDALEGTDNGYTNGIFFSWYDTPLNNKAKPGFLSRAMLWSLPDGEPQTAVNTNTIGQVMQTPEDIEIVTPPLDDLPYAGLLFYNNSYLAIQEKYADKVSVTLGVVGPLSGAEDTQKNVHDAIGVDKPEGWDTQLDNELVFQFSRARVWRSWVSGSDNFDLLLGVDGNLGTLQSSAGTSLMLRYGRGLQQSYASSLFASSKTANPVALNKGWFIFVGASPRYIFNSVFLDGNTYEDSRSIEYDHSLLAITAGFAYSWNKFALTYAVNDLDVNAKESSNELESYTKYGTLTAAWRY
jgi:lipid A 3-O-deacylase